MLDIAEKNLIMPAKQFGQRQNGHRALL